MAEKKDETAETLAGCVIVIGTMAMVPVAMLAWAWAAWMLWGWFAVPLLSLPSLGYVQILGLRLALKTMVGWSGGSTDGKKSTTEEDARFLFKAAFITAVGPPLTVGIGWLILQL